MIHRALFGSVERFMAILHRALRRQHADLALSRAGARARRARRPRRLRALRRRDPRARRASASASRRRASRSARGSARPSSRRSRTSWWSGTTTSRRARVGVNARGSNDPERGVSVAEFRERVARRGRGARFARGPVVALERFSAAWREDYVANVAQSHAADDGTCVFCALADRAGRRGAPGSSPRAS